MGFVDSAIYNMITTTTSSCRSDQGLDFDTLAVHVSLVLPHGSFHRMEISQVVAISANKMVTNGAVPSGCVCAATHHGEDWLVTRRTRRMDKWADNSHL